MRPYKRQDDYSFSNRLQLGFYPVRSKAQIARLLCEVLHIDYEDKFFTPDEWSRYKETQAKDWIIRDLPYLRDGQFVVTGPAGIVHYIIQKAGRADLLGRNLGDRIKIDSLKSKHDLKNSIEGLICAYQQEPGKVEKVLATRIEPIFRDYETECPQEGWYFGYFTVMDFVIYQLLNLTASLFPGWTGKFPKLIGLQRRFGEIPQIKAYEESPRAVKELSPLAYFQRFKQEKLRNRQMDIE